MPVSYTTKDGKVHKTILLVNGWWGVARHFNYIPELCLALSWGLPARKLDIIPYFYFTFLCILLFDRASRDEKRCGAKYGKDWELYKERVPYSMIPGIF
jgi:7-dehydrocholesterol reductase